MQIKNITVSQPFFGLSRMVTRLGDSPLKAAIQAAFRPFGSLTKGVDGEALAQAILAWIESPAERAATAGRIWSAVASATTDQMSAVQLRAFGVTLVTPTSGTEIRVAQSSGRVTLTVDFGPSGSESRAWTILGEMAIHSVEGRGWVPYQAQPVAGGPLTEGQVLTELTTRLEKTAAWIEGENCTWNQDSKRSRLEELEREIHVLGLRLDSLETC